MNTKWLTNPFFIYIMSFLLVMLVYNLEWSDRYPPLAWNLRIFFIATFVISFPLGFVLEKYRRNEYSPIQVNKRNLAIIAFMGFGYLLEFIHAGGIPFLLTLKGGYSYKEFTGIPTFHVLLGTFTTFYAINLFHQYHSATQNRKQILIFYIITISFHLMCLNRGAIMIVLAASMLIYLMKAGRIKIMRLLLIPLGLIGVIFLFGVVGNIRYSASKEDKEYILRIGGASDDFIQGNVPFEYYWGYLYIATPIGNFQNIINENEAGYQSRNLAYFAATEPTPDFIGKRLLSIFRLKEPNDNSDRFLVNELLNAPTVYFQSFFLLGWTGAWLMFCHSTLVMLIYPFLINKQSGYFVTGLVCLSTITLFNIFSNMWTASGTVLFWPLICAFLERLKFNK